MLNPHLVLIITTFIGATTVLLGEIALRTVEPFPLLTIRFVLAAILLGLFKRNEIFPLNKKSLIGGLAIGSSFGVGCAMLYFGLKVVHAGRANFLISLEVLCVPILLYFINRTKPKKSEWFAIPLALVGLWLLTASGDNVFTHGDLIIVLSTISYAFYAISLSHFSPHNNSYQLSFIALLFIAVLSWIITFFLQQPVFISFEPHVLWIILYLAAIGSVARFCLQSWAQKIASPTETILIFALEPVITAILSVSFLGEPLTYVQMLGGGIIVVSSCMSLLKSE
jgi:drug/metabolite transporter (DMT)-like permease